MLFVPLPRSIRRSVKLFVDFFFYDIKQMSNAYKRYKRFLLPTANIARTDPLIHKMTSQKNNFVSNCSKIGYT